MKFLLPLTCTIVVVFSNSSKELYDINVSSAGVQKVLTDPAVLKGYVLCYVDKAPCSEKHLVFKAIIPEVLETACSKCPMEMKSIGKMFMDLFIKRHPEEYEAFKKKYDPNGKYMDAFLASLVQY